MRRMISAALATLFLAGCASNDHHDSNNANNGLPLAVQSAFLSEHPYAKIDQTQDGKDPAGNEIFIINYSNPDGSRPWLPMAPAANPNPVQIISQPEDGAAVSQRALIVWGGWKGHEPEQVAEIFRQLLIGQQFDVEISGKLKVLTESKLAHVDLIVPIWTMGSIKPKNLAAVLRAVEHGVGMAGCHGGMCDAFRESTEWQFLTGGQFVAHPGGDGTNYTVHITPGSSPLTTGLADFSVQSEQYYMHVDPAVKVLATTRFPTVDGPHAANGPVEIPVAWTKLFGHGRIFYCSLGHNARIVAMPTVLELMRRGFLWAARQ